MTMVRSVSDRRRFPAAQFSVSHFLNYTPTLENHRTGGAGSANMFRHDCGPDRKRQRDRLASETPAAQSRPPAQRLSGLALQDSERPEAMGSPSVRLTESRQIRGAERRSWTE